MADNPTPETLPGGSPQPAPVSPPQGPIPGVTPGAQNYDPLLDPRVSQWRDSLLAEAGRKEREIAALKEQVKTGQDQAKPLQEQLAELQKKERERAEAEMTEVQKYQSRHNELEQQARDRQVQHEAAQAELLRLQQEHAKDRDTWRNEREMIALFGVRGIYPNEFEQDGLFARLRSLSYATEEERQQRLTALIDSFVMTRGGSNGAQHQKPAGEPSLPTGPAMTDIPPTQIPTPPGGSPSRTPQLIEDNYTDQELTRLARTNRELYNKIADQRAAMRRARGVLPVYVQ